jgi:hypothetical protein
MRATFDLMPVSHLSQSYIYVYIYIDMYKSTIRILTEVKMNIDYLLNFFL